MRGAASSCFKNLFNSFKTFRAVISSPRYKKPRGDTGHNPQGGKTRSASVPIFPLLPKVPQAGLVLLCDVTLFQAKLEGNTPNPTE